MEAIKSGSLQKWVKPWRSFGFPMNAYTYKYYGLLNTFWLTNDLVKFGFTYPIWATENQWKKLGYALKAGNRQKQMFYTLVMFKFQSFPKRNLQLKVARMNKKKRKSNINLVWCIRHILF
ncbi:ArdC-like ssDNA-binding domain-containing protein [Leptospira levettii]|uniref:ArdC-like ssDNA-binding domain-containing protein n=1 Tax=Leptospira levettii TaxID=2023178 RepID=UPI003CCFE283